MSQTVSRPDGWDRKDPPRWARGLIWQTLAVVAVALVLLSVLRSVRVLLMWLLFAVFLSLALQPAVDYLEKRGWRRGISSLLLLAVLGLTLVGSLFMVIPLLIEVCQLIVDEIPGWLVSLSSFTERCCDVTFSADSIRASLEAADVSLATYADDALALVAGGVGSVVEGVFAAFTVAMFAFYLTADAPRVRRSVLSVLHAEQQEVVTYVWDTAIDKMGGYVYSRIALALINGTFFYVVLRIFDVPFALPLAAFEGFVAAFIPIIGTYISVIVPALVALVAGQQVAVVAIVVYSLVYQQVENYWLSPRISAKTMSLHPAIALAAGIAGGLIGGLLWAFVALPVAATIQAAIAAYVEHHELIESERAAAAASVAGPRPEQPGSWRGRIAAMGSRVVHSLREDDRRRKTRGGGAGADDPPEPGPPGDDGTLAR